MKDKDLENQVNVKLSDFAYRKILDVSNATGQFKGEIVRRCVMRCIRQDRAPKWKRWIVKFIKY